MVPQGREEEYTYHFTEHDVAELAAAVNKTKAAGVSSEQDILKVSMTAKCQDLGLQSAMLSYAFSSWPSAVTHIITHIISINVSASSTSKSYRPTGIARSKLLFNNILKSLTP